MVFEQTACALKQPCGWSRMVESDGMENIAAPAGEPQVDQRG